MKSPPHGDDTYLEGITYLEAIKGKHKLLINQTGVCHNQEIRNSQNQVTYVKFGLRSFHQGLNLEYQRNGGANVAPLFHTQFVGPNIGIYSFSFEDPIFRLGFNVRIHK